MYKIVMENRMDRKVVVVGCGGTGGFVAEGLCRILPPEQDLVLVDYDRVEPHNLIRQNFHVGDIGKFKSQVLAERFASIYGRSVGYSVLPYSRNLLNRSIWEGMGYKMNAGLIIGCVDGPVGRTAMANLEWGDWWLDAGNGHHSGQVLIGNTTHEGFMKECFDEQLGLVNRLPAPSLQQPSLLAPLTTEPQRDCAQAVAIEEQSPVINQSMATLVLDFVYKLMRGELTWMGAYIDMEAGMLSTVPADPVTVARMMSIKVDSLWIKGCHVGNLSRRVDD